MQVTPKKILHICVLDKFIEPYYIFAKKHFSDFDQRHLFFIKKSNLIYKMPVGRNIYQTGKFDFIYRYFWFIYQANHAEKIILHGIWDYKVLLLLVMQPWLLRRCYWVIWGGDLYVYKLGRRNLVWQIRELIRRFAIRRIGHFITHVKGDFSLAGQWYGALGNWHECFMYPSNLYREYPKLVNGSIGINVLVGNSADPSNNHMEVLDQLSVYKSKDFRVYCPLSYGDPVYAKKVCDYGKFIFGDNFICILNFMEFDKYLELLAGIDIAIFNHRRQQGMGNITVLLGLGKKVYMRGDVTSRSTFERIGAVVYDISSLNLKKIDAKVAEQNKRSVAAYFSEKVLIAQSQKIFN